MSRSISTREVDQVLMHLGIAPTRESRQVVRRLATDSEALLTTVRRLPLASAPDASALPNVDEAVTAVMRKEFATCTTPELLIKPKKINEQCRLLLSVLLDRVGESVPLRELVLVNGLRSATARRLRELEHEHGAFRGRAERVGQEHFYVLASPEPDLEACAAYWLRHNIRQSSLKPHQRLLALLSAYVRRPVPIDDLRYVLPEQKSAGRGRARASQGAVARRIRELRDFGYRVPKKKGGYVLASVAAAKGLPRIPPKVRTLVLQRDAQTCRDCGWRPGMKSESPRRLEVHHEEPQRARPEDVHDPSKLVTLCSACHAGVEAQLKKRIPRKH